MKAEWQIYHRGTHSTHHPISAAALSGDLSGNAPNRPHPTQTSTRFWSFLDRSAGVKKARAGSDYRLRQVSEAGQTWWYALEPTTGEMIYFASQQDLDRWIDQQMS